MKDMSLVDPEHTFAKSSATTTTVLKKNADHGYAKSSSSSKKMKKQEIIDPKQRKLSFAKIPTKKHDKIMINSSSSDSDEPLSHVKNGKDEDGKSESVKKAGKTDNGLEPEKVDAITVKSALSVIKEVEDKGSLKSGSPKSVRKTLIPAVGFDKKKSHKQKPASSKSGSINAYSKGSKKKEKKQKLSSSKSKNIKVDLTSDSDSDLDVPLSQLKNSPKFKNSPKVKITSGSSSKGGKTSKKCSASSKKIRALSQVERSPKVKISHVKSPTLKNKVPGEKEFKQRTLFDFSAQMTNESVFSQKRPRVMEAESPNKKAVLEKLKWCPAHAEFLILPKPGELHKMGILAERVDWKSLTEEEREKIRQQKKEEWNRVRRERNKMLNQKHDDLELPNITPLPAAKPIKMEGGLASTAFGDIAMIIEFIYAFNKFLAPEETPAITAELLIKALAAGSQGADVISKILLVFLRALIGEEEREINGLGIGLADMPLTVFTVSELLYHYLKLTCNKPPQEKVSNESKDEDDDDDDTSSVGSASSNRVDEEEMPKRIIDFLEKNEFFTLSASDQLKILVFLFHKIIDSEYFSEYLENLKMETKELWRQQDAYRKKAAKERKEEQTKTNEDKNQTPSDSMKIDQFATKAENIQKSDSQTTEEDVKTVEAETKKEEKEEQDERKVNKEEMKKETKEVKKEVKSEKSEAAEASKNLGSKADDDLMKNYPKEPVADLVHIVRQRRVMAAKQAAMKDEEERKEKERRKEMDELQQKMKKVQAWKDGLDRCKKSLRLDPIGVDRHFKLYWMFSHGMPGIYIEDGWMYHAGEKRTIDSWEYYDTVEDIDKLLKALAKQGIRESALKTCLSNQYKTITNIIKKRNQELFELQPYDVFEESIKILKEDMLESGTKIVKGALGMISKQEEWEKKVEEGKSLEEMVPLLLELQQSVLPKFLQGTMDQSKGEEVIKNWRENVKSGKTLSTLHTLLGILENSVKWDKSSENVKCKICRRKAGDEYLVLCDECNRGYHPYCLRPALLDFPSENWKCPACEPVTPASRARTRRKEEVLDYDETARDQESADEDDKEEEKEEDDEEESDHESLCHVCGEDGELICCDQCPKVYHLDCHEPPIRRLPRGIWICFVCRNPKMASRFRRAQEQIEKPLRSKSNAGNSKKKDGRKSSRTSRRGRNSNPTDEDEEEQSEADSDLDDSSEESDDSEKRVKNRRGGSRKKQESTSENYEDDEEGSPPVKKQKRRKANKPKEKGGRISHTGEESSDPSPKSRKRKKGRSSKTNQTYGNDDSDSGEEVPKKRQVTRKRNLKDEGSNGTRKEKSKGKSKAWEEKSSKGSAELSFGRRARSRNRGQNSEIVACENVLRGMWKSKFAFHFRDPVDPKKVPDYEKFVTNPIDLSSIRDKLEMLEYEDAFQFVDDVKLMFENSKSYNEEKSEVAEEGKKLECEFFELLEEHLPGLHNSLGINT